jgi:hypothetical protein
MPEIEIKPNLRFGITYNPARDSNIKGLLWRRPF